MPDLHARLEAVLRKYGVIVPTFRGVLQPGSPEGMDDAKKTDQQFLDDLLACYPQPSREELDKLLTVKYHRQLSINREQFLDDLMAWATGEPRREWCEHLFWDTTPDVVTKHPHWCLRNSGILKGYADRDIEIPDTWKICPLCATPRPEGM